MRLDTKNKIIRLSLIVFALVLIVLFVPLFNGCYFGLGGAMGESGEYVIMAVLFPVMSSAILLLSSGYYKSFTKQDAINQIEKQYKNGVISTEHYKKSLKEIELFELEKNKLLVEIEVEKEEFKNKLRAKVQDLQKEVKKKKGANNEQQPQA